MVDPAQAQHPGARHGPASRHPAPHGGPGAHNPPKPPAKPKTAVLDIARSDNGEATYQLLIDGQAQPLKNSAAHWDDATPWESGTYGAAFSPLRGKYDAFLIKYPPNRQQIKFHLGTATGHSEGCIVAPSAAITEIEKVLADNDIPKNKLVFHITGDFPIGFKLSVKNGTAEVRRGETLTLTLELTGGGAPGGVSKDIWFHIVADTLNQHQFELVHPEKKPGYAARDVYPDSKPGIEVRLAEGERTKDIEIRLTAPHPHAAAGHASRHPVHAGRPAPAVPTPSPTPGSGAPPAPAEPDIKAVFKIDNYKILNKAPGPAPYFYTPSNYKRVLTADAQTRPVTIKPAAPHP